MVTNSLGESAVCGMSAYVSQHPRAGLTSFGRTVARPIRFEFGRDGRALQRRYGSSSCRNQGIDLDDSEELFPRFDTEKVDDESPVAVTSSGHELCLASRRSLTQPTMNPLHVRPDVARDLTSSPLALALAVPIALPTAQRQWSRAARTHPFLNLRSDILGSQRPRIGERTIIDLEFTTQWECERSRPPETPVTTYIEATRGRRSTQFSPPVNLPACTHATQRNATQNRSRS